MRTYGLNGKFASVRTRWWLGLERLAVLGMVLCGAVACADEPSDDTGKGKTDAAIGSDSVDALDPGTTDTDEEFWVVYNRRLRFGGEATDNDTVLSGWRNPMVNQQVATLGLGIHPVEPGEGAIELTKTAFSGAKGLSCHYGCFVSPDLAWIAVAKGAADSTGHYTFALGAIDSQLQAIVDSKFGELEGVKYLTFAGNYLFYSKRLSCLNTGACQYEIRRRGPLGTLESDDVLLTKMAPDSDPDWKAGDTTYTGFFRVSQDGQTVVFQTPTIRSNKVWAWRDGKLSQLDFLCPNQVGETCVGSGSEYTDSDPVAVSPDGKQVVVFSVVDRWLKVHRYQVGTEVPPAVSNLVEVPGGGGNYRQAACGVITADQHAEVRYDPWFSADGKSVYFVGYSKCGGSTDKVWSDLMELPVSLIGGPIAWTSMTNWTRNPRNNTTKNRVIKGLALSPARKVFVVRSSAYNNSSGGVLADTDKRQLQDTELFTMVVGSRTLVPLTNEGTYDPTLPTTVMPR
jgi:hypothetical protein